jgi:predicted RNA-binding Zn-ribbon protein involved in translation (DUF1610 family)
MSIPEINQLRRAAGTVWHDCPYCGLSWPFPHPDAPANKRDWMCPTCQTVAIARLQRKEKQR